MSDVKLSTLSIILGMIVVALNLYGLLKPKAFAEAARKFPRYTPVGYALTLLGTIWFLYYVSQESVSDFAAMKKFFTSSSAESAWRRAFLCGTFCRCAALPWCSCSWPR